MFWPFPSRSRQHPRPSVPAGERIYAVGDVHGRLDLLMRLMARIDRDDAARPHARTQIVMLGDIVDRGPHSAGVVAYLRRIAQGPTPFRFIAGNHEEAMLTTLTTPAGGDQAANWLAYGGVETLRSYGVPAGLLLPAALPDPALWRTYLPAEDMAFLQGFEDSVRIGDYLFVHAGIRPGVPLDRQDPADLRWIRSDFLDDRRWHGAMIVHGHTISERAELLPNRIGIDTGAYRSGILSAIGLEGEDRWIVDTDPAATL